MGESESTGPLGCASRRRSTSTGLPTLPLPCGLSGEGLPPSLQLVGRHRRQEVRAQTYEARKRYNRALRQTLAEPRSPG